MGNSKNKKGYRLTETGENIYAQKELHHSEAKLIKQRKNRQHNKVAADRYIDDEVVTDDVKIAASPITEEVSDFINEGNPNTQPPLVAETDKPKPDTQPTEVPNIGKPDPQTPPPRGDSDNALGLYFPTADEFMSLSVGEGEEEK